MDIEKLATAAIEASISKTDVLSPFINEGDKEPSWDGFIYIYESKSKNKKNLKRVPVQVKGMIENDRSKCTITYPVSIIDLNNYLNNGGCVFFVVYLDENGENPKIYFNSLLPVKIRDILRQTKEDQQTKDVELSEFPSDNDKKVSALLSFHVNMEKQASFIHAPLLSMEEYEKLGLVEGIESTFMGYGKNRNPYDCIFQNDFYPYVRIKGSPLLHPVDGVTSFLHIAVDVNAVISVDGKEYYNSFRRILTKEEATAVIGNSCKLIVSKVNGERKITFTPTANLKYIVKDYEFILDVYKHNGFEINGDKLQFDCKTMISADGVKNIADNLEYARKIEQLFSFLRLNKDYDLSKMTQEERNRTARLISGLVDKQPLRYNNIVDSISLSVEEYAGTKIILEFDKVEEPDTYRIYDFFNGEAVFCYSYSDDPNESHILTSRYSTVLHTSEFLEVGNIDYELILNDFEQYNDEINYNAQNQTLLAMITAYDQSKDQRKDILEYAERLAVSLLRREKDETGNDLPFHVLNVLQIAKRKRELSKEEQKKAFTIAEDTNQGEDMRTGAYLLLDNQLAAEAHFAKIPEKDQEGFRTFPIYRFWKK